MFLDRAAYLPALLKSDDEEGCWVNSAKYKGWSAASGSMRSDGLAACFVASISGLAQITGVPLLLFPELAALSFDIFRRPHGAWAKAPILLVVTPFLTGLMGTVVARNLPYGLTSVLIIVFLAILIVRALRSPIVPAVAAGLLPLIIGQTSWWYAPSLLIGTSMLAGISVIRLRLYPLPEDPQGSTAAGMTALRHSAGDFSWVPFFTAFLAVSAGVGVFTGERLFLLPPLVVVAIEIFAHFETCPWVKRPFQIPVVCGLSALSSVAIISWMGTGPLAICFAMIAVVIIVRVFTLHFPPAIAVAILPFIMPHFDFRYPAVVVSSSILLMLAFFLWRRSVWRREKRSRVNE